MLEKQNFSLSSLISKQYYANAINIIVPFKLGEVYRIVEINKLVGDFNRTFITIIAERCIDFLILFCGLFIALLIEDYQLTTLTFTITLGVIFIFMVLFIYFVMPENIKSINLFLAKRHKGNFIIRLLSFTTRVYSSIQSMRGIFKKRYSTILLLSLFIWSCEVLGFLFLIGFVGLKLAFFLAFLVFLSPFLLSGMADVNGYHAAFKMVSELRPDFRFEDMAYLYQMLTFTPAIIIGITIYIILFAKKYFPFQKST